MIRCSRGLPEGDPLKQTCLKALTLTNTDRKLFLRSLFLLGCDIHCGKIVSGRNANVETLERSNMPTLRDKEITSPSLIANTDIKATSNDLPTNAESALKGIMG
jgi:hypothetical protein